MDHIKKKTRINRTQQVEKNLRADFEKLALTDPELSEILKEL